MNQILNNTPTQFANGLLVPSKEGAPTQAAGSLWYHQDKIYYYNVSTGNWELMSSGGGGPVPPSFEYVTSEDHVLNVSSSGMKKIIVTEDTTFDASDAPIGGEGKIIAKIDDEGGHVFYYAENNEGQNPQSNSFARAETLFEWFKTDDVTYWTSRILREGIEQTVLPVFAIDDYYKTLEIFSSFTNDQIVLSTNNGPWLPYTGPFAIADLSRSAGYWKAKVLGGDDRIESKIQSSLPTHQGLVGFPLRLSLILN